MANVVYKYKFDPTVQPYQDDFGTEQVLNPLLRVPSDTPAGSVDQIIQCIGAFPREDTATCSSGSLFTPRKLVFRRTNGNSFSVIVPDRESLLTYAQCVKDIFAGSDFPIVCVEYIGETHTNIKERFSNGLTAVTPIARIKPPDTEAKNILYYTGYMREYATESGRVYGQVQALNFKSQTRVKDSPLAELTAYFNDCVGELDTNFCSSKSSIVYRRFNVGFAVVPESQDDGNGVINDSNIQFVTAPSKAHTSSSLLECATTLANITSAACIEYVGESNNKLHLLLGN